MQDKKFGNLFTTYSMSSYFRHNLLFLFCDNFKIAKNKISNLNHVFVAIRIFSNHNKRKKKHK